MDTIAAISTPQGVGGIGVIRISGSNALSVADKIFVPYSMKKDGVKSLSDMKGYTAKYGKITDSGEFIDDAVVLVFRAPHSYTGEDVVEISCHGGMYITRRVLRLVLENGALPAEPGEFTKRAFLNGKMDLSQAEAVMDLISAKGERANKIAFSMREGSSGKKIGKIKEILLDILARLSVWSDYPEDGDIPQIDSKMLKKSLFEVKSQISDMIKGYDACKILKEGVKTAIIGRPNVGKSTLMNCLSGHEKSIVTNIPGTTRDVIEESVMLGDIPLLLIDTAGIRETDDIIEKIGVKKSREYMDISDITLLVLDSSSALSDEDRNLLKSCDKSKTIIILNKCDLKKMIDTNELLTFSDKIVELSAINGSGTEKLKEIIENMIGISEIEPSDVVISSERQLNSLKKVKEIIEKSIEETNFGMTLDAITVLLQDAMEILMNFTGENASEEIVNRVFEKFCVGK
mgnify:CR=1 FL=1